MATKLPTPQTRTLPKRPTELKAERIQLKAERIQLKAERIQKALKDLPGWGTPPPRQRIERSFHVRSEDRLGRFINFVLRTIAEKEVEFALHVEPQRLNVSLGGLDGVTEAHLAVANAINHSVWGKFVGPRAA